MINDRKTVMISEKKHFGHSLQFDSHYPNKLTGIIPPDEFEESIANINRAIRPTLYEKILIFSLFLCSLIGLLIFIAGISVIWLSISALWIPLMSIGFVVFMVFFTIVMFVSSWIYRSCDTRADRAVKAESMKYSMKRPVPTRWRLDMTIYARRSNTASPTDIQHFLLIDIDERAGLEMRSDSLNSNSNSSKSISNLGEQYPTSSDKTLHIEEQVNIHSSV